RQREALALRYFLDLPEAEIAAAMGVSAGSVKTHVHRGLATLAQLLGEKDQ
ncbi:MAG: sigma factor-like helix-turn-helix DNA-binding protein, partial [Candidatus Limnocylindrales bacterium]